MKSFAYQLLTNSSEMNEKAESYIKTAERNFQLQKIEALALSINKKNNAIEDIKFSLTLDTDVNAGKKEMTREEISQSFIKMAEFKREIYILKEELDLYLDLYKEFFSENEAEKKS